MSWTKILLMYLQILMMHGELHLVLLHPLTKSVGLRCAVSTFKN